MQKIISIVISGVLLALTLTAFTGCGGVGSRNFESYDSKGKIKTFSPGEVDTELLSLYAPKDEEYKEIGMCLFVNPISVSPSLVVGDKNVSDSSQSFQVITLRSTKVNDFDPLIVKVQDKYPLLACVPTEEQRVVPVTAKPYLDMGYTFATSFSLGSDQTTVYFDTGGVAKDSDLEAKIKSAGLTGLVRVVSINGEEFPFEQIDVRTGILPNLTQNGLYELVISKGSIKKTIKVIADTKILQENKDADEVSLGYQETEAGFFKVDTTTLPEGFWVISPYNQLVQKPSGSVSKDAGTDTKSETKKGE